ncbi:MAG: signal recognition particle protein [Candidatus Improbicoccus devescovinae]|nr:MAG: signal recognition particle protein [Candidatus Improbicoccus devescovinae]
MAFEGLTEKLTRIFKKMSSKGRLTEFDIKDSMRDVRLALLEADVNYLVVKDLISKISEKATGSEILKSLTPAQMVIKIVNTELENLMGPEPEIKFKPRGLTVIMLCGLQGSGKTTQAVKLAVFLRKKGYKPLISACDIYRPAAIKQLQVLAKSVNIDVYSEDANKDVVEIAQNSHAYAHENSKNLLILDTAGRLQLDEILMKELESIKIALNPVEILLVVDSMAGQDAVSVAQVFDKRIDITGVVLTKFDGDSRGGAALSIRAVVGKPIKFIGTGERPDNIELFHPKRIVSRILGMGDVLSLIESAEEVIDKERADEIAKKMAANKFDFNDFLNMINQVRRMGPLKSIFEKLPAMGNLGDLGNLNFDDNIIKKIEAMIYSMRPEERRHPDIINSSRKRRIANGSGNQLSEVNSFFKRFEETCKIMKNFTKNKHGWLSNFLKKR